MAALPAEIYTSLRKSLIGRHLEEPSLLVLAALQRKSRPIRAAKAQWRYGPGRMMVERTSAFSRPARKIRVDGGESNRHGDDDSRASQSSRRMSVAGRHCDRTEHIAVPATSSAPPLAQQAVR